MADDIPPDWARARAQDMAREYREARNWNPTRDVATEEAFARYIAAHEEPPVDPLLIEAREIVSEDVFGSRKGGEFVVGTQESLWVEYVYRGLKRGIELAREQS